MFKKFLIGLLVVLAAIVVLVVIIAVVADTGGDDSPAIPSVDLAATIAPAATTAPTATSPPTATPEPLRTSGRGDSVVSCTMNPGRKVFTMTHDGTSNFAIWLYDDADGAELLVNEIGRYSGSTTVKFGSGILDLAPGPCTLEISADGNWSIEISN